MIHYEAETRKVNNNSTVEVASGMEDLLADRINECLSNARFLELPISAVYRVVEKCKPSEIDNNKLFDFIKRSFEKFYVLLQFLDLTKISEQRLDELCRMHSEADDGSKRCFSYLGCSLDLVMEMRRQKRDLQCESDGHRSRAGEMESKVEALEKQLSEWKKVYSEQQSRMKDLEGEVSQLQGKFKESEKVNSQLQVKFKESEKVNSQLQAKLSSSEKEIGDIRAKLKRIRGKVVASVENGGNVSFKIKLNCESLDTARSKYIISTSGAEILGSEAYEKGDAITSLSTKETVALVGKPGLYYVRCIIFDGDGESFELVSNSVTAGCGSATLEYEGRPVKVALCEGRYRLEVWGAKGGDSTGKGYGNRKIKSVPGGLGGYSSGILSLNKSEAVHVYVGGEGQPSGSAEGARTGGGFPDGGGARTGHCFIDQPTVPGTGGGSTSIRIGSGSDYSRVIVAGGGGGAGGCCCREDPGGFGGGLSGGNCSFDASLESQGAGTQTGSTRGLGDDGKEGNAGRFGSGADGNYGRGRDSGGGGGGGWYGGGSGGFGYRCSSGGGGSGWTFTASSFNTWKSGDSTNASKFALGSAYYLAEVKCMSGSEEFPRPNGNGTERGHPGNGCAKITLL